MKGFIFVISALLVFSCSEEKEEDFEGRGSFHISKPEGWFDELGSIVKADAKKLKVSNEQLEKITDTYRGLAPICVYTKYNSEKDDVMLPTIEVNVAVNAYKNFESFKDGVERSAIEVKNSLRNYEYIKEPTEVKIDGIQSIYFLSIYDLEVDSTTTHSIKSWTYAIPSGNRFYQINFSDMEGEAEPSDSLFENVLRSIKIN